MTTSNRYENLAPKYYEDPSELGMEGEDDLPDYSDLEDPLIETPGEDDFYLEDEGLSGAEDLGYVPQDPAGIREWLMEWRDSGKITKSEYQSTLAQVNRSTGLSGQKRAEALAKITGEISAKFAEQVPDEAGFPGEDGSSEDLPTQAESIRKTIESLENLRESDKKKFYDRIDQEMHRLDLSKDGPDGGETVRDEISMTLEEISMEATELGAHPPGVTALANALGADPAELKLPEGFDLENPPLPPTGDFLNKLAELSPELKAAFDQVETAVNERVKHYQETLRRAKSTNEVNLRSTTDGDSHDIQPWQDLFDLKHFQDQKSGTVVEAMKAAVAALKPVLEAIYQGQDIKSVEVSGVTGWERTEAEYQAADKLQIGNMTIDLFNNQDGTLLSSTASDSDFAIEIPSIAVDREGDGEWNYSSFQSYGDGQPGRNDYDPDS